MWARTDEAGRLTAVSDVQEYVDVLDEEGEPTGVAVRFEPPDGFDVDRHGDYRLVDGQLVEDPQGQSPEERVAELKAMLAQTDYVVIKIAEAQASGVSLLSGDEERYEDIIEQRRAWRAEINSLEGEGVSE